MEGQSYALDPARQRHPIRVTPNPCALEQQAPFVADFIYVLKSSGKIRIEEFPFRLWTFYYNPPLHSLPN